MSDLRNHLSALVAQALDELDSDGMRLELVYRKAIRIARLRGDFRELFWLQLDVEALGDRAAQRRLVDEVSRHFSQSEMETLFETTQEDGLAMRRIDVPAGSEFLFPDGAVLGLNVADLDRQIVEAESRVTSPAPTARSAKGPVDRWAEEGDRETLRDLLGQYQKVQRRRGRRLHTYLSQVEDQLYEGDESDLAVDNRRFLEAVLPAFAPEVLDQLSAAKQRMREGTAESRSHALTSCRRALKSLADRLYPPRKEPVLGADGQPHQMTEDRFVARLWQFVFEYLPKNAARRMLAKDVDEVGSRIDDLNELASKGVHAQVTELELKICVSRMELLIADLMRVQLGESAALHANELAELDQ